jgi:hypothetical protein
LAIACQFCRVLLSTRVARATATSAMRTYSPRSSLERPISAYFGNSIHHAIATFWRCEHTQQEINTSARGSKPTSVAAQHLARMAAAPRSSTAAFRTLTFHRVPRCSFSEADINWASNFSIHKRLSMRSCTTCTLHVSRAIAILGYAAQVLVRAGSVIAHLASLNRDGPNWPPLYLEMLREASRNQTLYARRNMGKAPLCTSSVRKQLALLFLHVSPSNKTTGFLPLCHFDDFIVSDTGFSQNTVEGLEVIFF